MACVAGASGPNNMTGHWEWVADLYFGSGEVMGISDGMFLWMQRYPNFARLTPVISQAAHKSKTIREFQWRTFETGISRIAALVALCPKFKDATAQEREEITRGIYCTIQGAGHLVINNNLIDECEAYRSASAKTIAALLPNGFRS